MARSVLVKRPLAVLAALIAGGLVGGPGVARADDEVPNGSQPVSYSARPLTLPTLTLSPSVEAVVDKLSTATVANTFKGVPNPKNLNVNLVIGASMGIFENLEIGAVFAPLQVLPKVAYGDPGAHVTFRFVKGGFELAGYFAATAITGTGVDPQLVLPVLNESAGILLQPGILTRIHMGGRAKLDIGATVPIQLGSGVHDLGLNVPVELAFNLLESFHIGANSGVGIQNLDAPALTSYIPLGLNAGVTIGNGEKPFVDIGALFNLPQFVNPGVKTATTGTATMPATNSTIDVQDFQAGITVTAFLYFM